MHSEGAQLTPQVSCTFQGSNEKLFYFILFYFYFFLNLGNVNFSYLYLILS